MFIGIGMQEHLIEVGCLKEKLKKEGNERKGARWKLELHGIGEWQEKTTEKSETRGLAE